MTVSGGYCCGGHFPLDSIKDFITRLAGCVAAIARLPAKLFESTTFQGERSSVLCAMVRLGHSLRIEE